MPVVARSKLNIDIVLEKTLNEDQERAVLNAEIEDAKQ